ncbi:MAG TPA: hypothetical protein VN628_05495 [Vicinamibacterales bacterium]|nr:hypothetical protein [Vicinamibacterales bacterium]
MRFLYACVTGGLKGDGTIDFIGATFTTNVAVGQKVFLSANKAMGSNAAGGAGGMRLYVCYRNTTGSSVVAVGAGSFDYSVPQNIRSSFGMSGVITGLAPGNYEFGMCAQGVSTPANWNNNEYGYVSGMLLN